MLAASSRCTTTASPGWLADFSMRGDEVAEACGVACHRDGLDETWGINRWPRSRAGVPALVGLPGGVRRGLVLLGERPAGPYPRTSVDKLTCLKSSAQRSRACRRVLAHVKSGILLLIARSSSLRQWSAYTFFYLTQACQQTTWLVSNRSRRLV